MSLDLLDQLEANFNKRPISIIEFAESPEFCNRILYPRQRLLLKLIFLEDLTPQEEQILDGWIAGGRNNDEVEISPYIRERIQWLKENDYKHFREIVLVGGRRCSKGFITGIALAKKVFDLIQLQDPGRYYGIDPDKEIIFAAIAAAQDQAKDQQYADMSSMVNACKALSRNLTKLQELEFSVMTETDLRQVAAWKAQGRKILRDTATVRGKALPANSRTIRGSAMMGLVFDEFAHFMQGESDQSDAEVYAAAIPALAQFGRDGIIFANSSPYSKVGKFFERYEVGMETNDAGAASPATLSIRLPSWALFEGWWEDPEYRGPKKCITVSPDWDPMRKKEDGDYFYSFDDRQAIVIERDVERQDPSKYKVERRGHFAETIDAYLLPEQVDRLFKGRPIGMKEIEREDGSKGTEMQYLPLKTNTMESSYNYIYKAHLDPSSTTAGFGFALAHTEPLEIDGVQRNHVVFDIIKRWRPGDFPEGVIEWEPILEELMFYIEIFRPSELTMDQFNSAFPLQWLRRETTRRRRSETHIFEKTATSEANWNRAEVFRTALYQGRIHGPYDTGDCEWGSLELKFLQEIKTGRIPRVEKQDAGPVTTKDIADCMMTCVEDLIGNEISNQIRQDLATMPLSPGAPGGYPIGGPDRGGRGNPKHPLSQYYSERTGEQRLGVGMAKRDREGKVNPARRVAGGKPVPRKLPGW